MKEIYTNFLIRKKEAAKLSYDVLQERTGISASTLCRYFKGDAEPTMDTMERIVDALGANMRDLYAQVGEQEMKDSQQVDYKGASALLEDFSKRESLYKDHLSTLERSHASALKNRDETYERSVSYLKNQIAELKQDNKDLLERATRAEAVRDQLDVRRHHVFWGMLSIILVVLVLFAGAIIADLPQIGMGW